KADGGYVYRDGIPAAEQEVLPGPGIISDQVALLQDRLTDVREVAAQLHPREAAERVVRLREHIADHETLDLLRDDERVRGDLLHPRRQVVVQRLLRAAQIPVQAVRLVDVEREDLGFAPPAVHRAREHHRVVAEDIRQRDRSAAEEAAAEVIPLVPDG